MSDHDHIRFTSDGTFVEPVTESTPSVIPPDHPYRTLVLCFDGTGDQFDNDNSNIVEFFSLLTKGDKSKQMVYYQAGIGTYTTPEIATPFFSRISKSLDEAIAWNLHAHVMGGYEFLMQNYTSGDRICIFGFSRGAYTARSLAGMIHKVGILPACNHQQIPFAYKMYTRNDELGWKQSNAFKKTFSIDADIEFIGVWDTVNSVGLIPKRLPFTTSNTIVRTFRHAIALDERRAKFKANLWNRPNAKEECLGLSDHPECHHKQGHLERKHSLDSPTPTDVEEVWFAGAHCDVGGGSVSNGEKHTLARIPLRWMIRECFKTKTGIMFNTAGLRRLGLCPETMWRDPGKKRPPSLPIQGHRIRHPKTPDPQTMTPTSSLIKLNPTPNPDDPRSKFVRDPAPSEPILSEEERELYDALSPKYDQLTIKWSWWILELLPLRQRYQKGDNTWQQYLGMNLGRGRFIPKQKTKGVKVHRSVKMRMEALHKDGTPYQPKAKFDEAFVTWVD